MESQGLCIPWFTIHRGRGGDVYIYLNPLEPRTGVTYIYTPQKM